MTPETAYGILAVILVLFLATATAKAASDKGASATVWFIAGVLLPGAALVVALFLDEQLVKECPRCAHRINRDARICSYCGHEFTARGNDCVVYQLPADEPQKADNGQEDRKSATR